MTKALRNVRSQESDIVKESVHASKSQAQFSSKINLETLFLGSATSSAVNYTLSFVAGELMFKSRNVPMSFGAAKAKLQMNIL